MRFRLRTLLIILALIAAAVLWVWLAVGVVDSIRRDTIKRQSFYRSGQRQGCTPYVHGAIHGKAIEWYEDGRIKTERDAEHGILLRSRTFDESGSLIDEYERSENDPMMEYVRKRRATALDQ